MPQCGMSVTLPSTLEEIRFFLPGPAYVPNDVRDAMTRPMVAHRSPEFKELYRSVTGRLKPVFRTDQEVMTATGSATLLMELAVVSLVRRDVLSLVNGAFSARWHAVSLAAGKQADRIDVPWGRAVDPDLVRQALTRKSYDAVTLVHNETSTGVMNPLEDIARAVRESSDALILVDAVSSLGGAPVETDAWGLDLVLTGGQKALAMPPGLSFFTASERALERAETVVPRGFYTDLLRYRDKHLAAGPITTPTISGFYAADVQLDRILNEGIEARWTRHRELSEIVDHWARRRGLTSTPDPAHRSWTVSCLEPPSGIEAPALIAAAGERGCIVASGYGDLKDTTFRIGHMGEVRESDLVRLAAVLDDSIEELQRGSKRD